MKNKKGSGSQLWGMITYELMGDGCLNGTWTNIHTESKKVMHEIARKKDGADKGDLPGEYYVAWIENKGGPVSGILKIESRTTHYYFEWVVSGKICFRGMGMMMTDRRLAVTYWDGDSITFPGGQAGQAVLTGQVGQTGQTGQVSQTGQVGLTP